MQENNQDPENEDFLKNLPIQSEDIGFKPAEMIACGKCSRANPPTRLKCMYCGTELDLPAGAASKIAPNLRKLENWEQGFNLIYLPDDERIDAETVRQIAGLIGHEEEFLQKILDARIPLPIARCETAKEAEILQSRIHEAGRLQTSLVTDEALAAETAPKRLRGIEFQDDKLLLILFNNDQVEEIGADDLALIVAGAIFQKSVASTEKRKKGETKILEATETASDESLIDIYTKTDSGGYRILTKGFDFSCLGAEKGILARENLKKLVARLAAFAPHARLVDDYLDVRNLLGETWEVEQRKDSQGLARQRFGKFDLSSVSTSSNLQQFTKYSRLQWHIL